MKCLPCGQDNASSALFCTACRRPLVAPTTLPTRLEPQSQPAMAAAAPAMASPYGGAAGAASSRNRFAPPEATRTSRPGSDNDSGILTEDEAWAAVVGEGNTSYYLTRFERLARGESGGWHWPAFFVAWFWMLYRKMWKPALVYLVVNWVGSAVVRAAGASSPGAGAFLNLGWLLAMMIVPGMLANSWYFKHCEKKIDAVRAKGGSREQMVARLEAGGGTGGAAAIVVVFLVVIMVVGILAAVALPAYQTYTVKAKVAQAVQVGTAVAGAVGKQYEQTGQLPSQSDVDNVVRQAAPQSKFVTAIDLDSSSGTLTVHVSAPPAEGTFQLVPSSDNNHHLRWTCSSSDELRRYAPASCR